MKLPEISYGGSTQGSLARESQGAGLDEFSAKMQIAQIAGETGTKIYDSWRQRKENEQTLAFAEESTAIIENVSKQEFMSADELANLGLETEGLKLTERQVVNGRIQEVPRQQIATEEVLPILYKSMTEKSLKARAENIPGSEDQKGAWLAKMQEHNLGVQSKLNSAAIEREKRNEAESYKTMISRAQTLRDPELANKLIDDAPFTDSEKTELKIDTGIKTKLQEYDDILSMNDIPTLEKISAELGNSEKYAGPLPDNIRETTKHHIDSHIADYYRGENQKESANIASLEKDIGIIKEAQYNGEGYKFEMKTILDVYDKVNALNDKRYKNQKENMVRELNKAIEFGGFFTSAINQPVENIDKTINELNSKTGFTTDQYDLNRAAREELIKYKSKLSTDAVGTLQEYGQWNFTPFDPSSVESMVGSLAARVPQANAAFRQKHVKGPYLSTAESEQLASEFSKMSANDQVAVINGMAAVSSPQDAVTLFSKALDTSERNSVLAAATLVPQGFMAPNAFINMRLGQDLMNSNQISLEKHDGLEFGISKQLTAAGINSPALRAAYSEVARPLYAKMAYDTGKSMFSSSTLQAVFKSFIPSRGTVNDSTVFLPNATISEDQFNDWWKEIKPWYLEDSGLSKTVDAKDIISKIKSGDVVPVDDPSKIGNYLLVFSDGRPVASNEGKALSLQYKSNAIGGNRPTQITLDVPEDAKEPVKRIYKIQPMPGMSQ